MKLIIFAMAIVQGLGAVFSLFALELIVNAIAVNGFDWPFSVWWGMVVSIPGLAIAFARFFD